MNRLIVLLLFFGVFLVTPKQGFTQSLPSALNQLLASHPLIEAAQADVMAADYGIDSAKAAWTPQVDLTAYTGRERHDRAYSTDFEDTTNKLSVSVTQLVWDFGATNAQIAVKSIDHQSSLAALEITRQDLILEGARSYLGLLRAKNLLLYAHRSTLNVKEQVELERKRMKSGRGSGADLLQAQAQLAGTLAREVRQQGELEQANNSYFELFSEPVDELKMLAEERFPELPENLDAALQLAADNSLQLKFSRHALNQRDKQVVEARASGFFPSFKLVTGYSASENPSGTVGSREEYLGTLEASYSFDLGLSAKSDLWKARSNRMAQEKRLDNVLKRVSREVKDAWSKYHTSSQNLVYLTEQLNRNVAFLELARKERELGTRSLLDLLSGETNLLNAESELYSARVEQQVAIFELLHAVGRLNLSAVMEAKSN
ncbi:TolC family protein [Magnetococcus sp. PR-3]|uniref:TolC family protein n=1 Tax=Magnetococcus sp. PR-3 TaxID=3120355 RepID=UPI002FCE2AA8